MTGIAGVYQVLNETDELSSIVMMDKVKQGLMCEFLRIKTEQLKTFIRDSSTCDVVKGSIDGDKRAVVNWRLWRDGVS